MGVPIISLLRVYQALILSRLDYGCEVYGSARICVKTTGHNTSFCSALVPSEPSPVTSLYVVCHEPPLELRRRQLRKIFYSCHGCSFSSIKNFSLVIGLTRLYEAHSFNIKPFSE
ncbi:putative RNA-directed DNA polymerase from transposon X-element [Trichonephila clavipes]|nr:putative RNA-directed DNA polymerase from transposon X-element [Trichonephila clavipes]